MGYHAPMTDTPFLHDSHQATAVHNWLQGLHARLRASNHRALIALCGEKTWARSSARVFEQALDAQRVLHVSADIPHALPPSKARSRLGEEYDLLLFDAFDDFDVDAFAALSGTLCGGGVLLLLLPDVEQGSTGSDFSAGNSLWTC